MPLVALCCPSPPVRQPGGDVNVRAAHASRASSSGLVGECAWVPRTSCGEAVIRGDSRVVGDRHRSQESPASHTAWDERDERATSFWPAGTGRWVACLVLMPRRHPDDTQTRCGRHGRVHVLAVSVEGARRAAGGTLRISSGILKPRQLDSGTKNQAAAMPAGKRAAMFFGGGNDPWSEAPVGCRRCRPPHVCPPPCVRDAPNPQSCGFFFELMPETFFPLCHSHLASSPPPNPHTRHTPWLPLCV